MSELQPTDYSDLERSGLRRARPTLILFGVALLMLIGLLLIFKKPIGGDAQKSIHAILSCLALALIASFRLLRPLVARGLLVVLLTFAVANMLRFSHERIGHIDRHDVTCYYLGAKYAPELGPFGLYPAVVYVDQTHRRQADMKKTYWAQNRDGFTRQRLSHARKEGKRLKKTAFEKARYKEFEKDVLYLQREMGRDRFRAFLNDKGFNGTPGWLLYAHPLMNWIPAKAMIWLVSLDLVFLGVGTLLVASTFGLDTALFLWLFLCVSISTKWLIPGSAILRYDWLALLIVAMCLIKRGINWLAGVAAALSGTFRIFPAVWIYGPVTRLAFQLWTAGKGRRLKYSAAMLSLVASFFVTTVVWQGLAVQHIGKEIAVDHAIKLKDHTSSEMISSKRPGLAIALSYAGEVKRKRMSDKQRERIEDFAVPRLGLALALLLTLAWALRRKTATEAFAFGYLPFFLLSTGTYYYHVARVTLVIFHAYQLVRAGRSSIVSDTELLENATSRDPNLVRVLAFTLRHQVGLAFFFLLEVHSNLMFYFFSGQEVFWTGWLSRALFGYAVGMTVWLIFENKRLASSE